MIRRGVTRTVYVGERWAVKIPGGLGFSYHGWFGAFVRGWLANRSEWRQRNRPDVNRPRFTFFHLALWSPVAMHTGDRCVALECQEWHPWYDTTTDLNRDEMKPDSWGFFRAGSWRLVDFDRAYVQGDRGLVGGLYYGRQERLAREWSKPVADG